MAITWKKLAFEVDVVLKSEHTKAAHDALGIDADTVDTKHFADIQSDAQGRVNTHASATTGVHGAGSNTIEHTGRKGAANGYCELDASTLVPLSRIPSTLTGKDADTVDTKHFTDIQADAQSKVNTHASATTGVHGVGTSTIESTAGSQAKVDTHAALSTGVHGVGSGTIAKVQDIAVDSNLSTAAQDAIAKRHDRAHALDSTSDHTIGSLTSGKLVKSDGTKLANASNTDAEVSDAVSKRHTQNSDTGLGTLGTKTTPIDNDKVVQRNSEASDALVTSTWGQIKSFLKTYFDTVYAAIGNAILKSLVTTKGDLIVAQDNANPQRLEVGTNDYVLIADSSQTLGVKWGVVPSHALRHQDGGADEINVTGLSGVLSDAQKVTVRKNSGTNVGTRPRLNFVEGTNITLTVADDATDNEIDITIAAAGGGGFDPSTKLQFYEEFDSVLHVSENILHAGNIWEPINTAAPITISSAERGGVIRFAGCGSGSYGPFLRPTGSNTSLPYASSKNPTVIVRQAQYGTSPNITRYIGLGSADLNAAPANGIYFRYTTNGNYIGVCRSGGSETTLNTGVAASNGTFHTLKFVVNGTTSVEFFVDGVSKGTITTNIPTANLYFSCGSSDIYTTNGMYLNYVYISQNR